jgi:hypothetical protein
MKVSELIELLKQMPQDLHVEMGIDESGQISEDIQVSLEKFKGEEYVFIGNY